VTLRTGSERVAISTRMAVGDDLVSDANVVFDHSTLIDATPEEIWPWIVQLGKHRAGWYLPAGLERLLPPGRRAIRNLEPRWQTLAVGDRVPDYGGRNEWLEVALIEPPHILVYRSERRGRPFTWALLLSPATDGRTQMRLRFRGRIRSRGAKRRAILSIGGFFDCSTGQLMIRGLQDRTAAGVRADPNDR
jgi:hypothetical protein